MTFLNPTKPLAPGDLARLQTARAAAQAWADSCEVDVLDAERKLARLVDERQTARDALRASEDAIQTARTPVALMRVG